MLITGRKHSTEARNIKINVTATQKHSQLIFLNIVKFEIKFVSKPPKDTSNILNFYSRT